MLVLRRKRGESFVIGPNAEVVVKILREEDGIVYLGVEAPKSVPIDRLEVYEKRKQDLELNEFSNKDEINTPFNIDSKNITLNHPYA